MSVGRHAGGIDLDLAPVIRLVLVIQMSYSSDMKWLVGMVSFCPCNRICLSVCGMQRRAAVRRLDSEFPERVFIDEKTIVRHSSLLNIFAFTRNGLELPDGPRRGDISKIGSEFARRSKGIGRAPAGSME